MFIFVIRCIKRGSLLWSDFKKDKYLASKRYSFFATKDLKRAMFFPTYNIAKDMLSTYYHTSNTAKFEIIKMKVIEL